MRIVTRWLRQPQKVWLSAPCFRFTSGSASARLYVVAEPVGSILVYRIELNRYMEAPTRALRIRKADDRGPDSKAAARAYPGVDVKGCSRAAKHVSRRPRWRTGAAAAARSNRLGRP